MWIKWIQEISCNLGLGFSLISDIEQQCFQDMRKNYAKFRLIVVWFGRTRDVKDFSDVTLAWEDEEQGDVWDLQVKVKVNNFNDMALAWEDEVWEKSSRTSRKVNVNWSTWAWEDGLKWKLFDERNYFEILSRRVWFYRWRIALPGWNPKWAAKWNMEDKECFANLFWSN